MHEVFESQACSAVFFSPPPLCVTGMEERPQCYGAAGVGFGAKGLLARRLFSISSFIPWPFLHPTVGSQPCALPRDATGEALHVELKKVGKVFTFVPMGSDRQASYSIWVALQQVSLGKHRGI